MLRDHAILRMESGGEVEAPGAGAAGGQSMILFVVRERKKAHKGPTDIERVATATACQVMAWARLRGCSLYWGTRVWVTWRG